MSHSRRRPAERSKAKALMTASARQALHASARATHDGPEQGVPMISSLSPSWVRGRRAPGAIVFAIFALLAVSPAPRAQTPPPVTPAVQGKAPTHAQVVKRLRITNAMVIPGSGVPAYGPVDILIEDGLIARVGVDPSKRWPAADAVIDATG